MDSGYPNKKGYLAPYKGQRYHVCEWQRGLSPVELKEVFNHSHSSQRNVIEVIWSPKDEMAYSLEAAQIFGEQAIKNYSCLYGPSQFH